MPGYDDLVEQAVHASVHGWDFSWLRGRTSGGTPSWRYTERASALLSTATRLLDLDTGGGEVLASLAPLPRHTVAMEAWQPNIPIAARRLRPLDLERYEQPLRSLHERIRSEGAFTARSHRFLIEAVLPDV
ncbi:hypothetical protein [Planomonospora parontospora]|uniref:hypothetical protein n=1 Tax=Planomonospora parontospora TaxID=58119 RepID=UPI0016705E6F|nr:hypothetical protein [Planomonospora parontospora]GGL37300.1 hypothetical protein GCM10014719_43030 [Planomonospora parontospora subsp. antibiotica]GII17602.1 hypothetical protein Ppa05_43280 [Planomonospora parontospora subsp. antibiotica]